MTCSKVVIEAFPKAMAYLIFDETRSRRTMHFFKVLKSQFIEEPDVLPDWLIDKRIVNRDYDDVDYEKLDVNRDIENIITLSSIRVKSPNHHDHIDPIFNNGFRTIPSYLLRYPLMDPMLPLSLNYAGIGWVIHHKAFSYENDTARMDNFVSRFLKTPPQQKAKSLDGYKDLSSIQTMILWWSRIWVCGSQRQGIVDLTEFHAQRMRNFDLITPYFKRFFKCRSFIFRDRPRFNIDNFLKKGGD